mgnify:CR=1 FL=1
MGALTRALTWTSVINRLRAAEAAAELRVLASHIGHPLDQGALQLDTGAEVVAAPADVPDGLARALTGRLAFHLGKYQQDSNQRPA